MTRISHALDLLGTIPDPRRGEGLVAAPTRSLTFTSTA